MVSDRGFVGGPLGHRNDGNKNSAGIIGTVAATPDVNLTELAKKYAGGFDGNTNSVDGRFGLVIGVNYTGGGAEAQINAAIDKFTTEWEKSGTFPVAVVGFTWKNSAIEQGKAVADQKTIPYGAIRETIIRHPRTGEITQQVLDAGPGTHTYLHTGDADVDSLVTENGPLFDAVNAKIDVNSEFPPEVISGGYHVRDQDGPVAVKAAAIDLAVRGGMAKVDPRSVYFPEPNTFVRVNPDTNGKVETDITFGVANGESKTLNYHGPMEGRGLFDSVLKQRGPGRTGNEDPMAVFDPRLATKTDGSRVGQKLGGDSTQVLSIVQSHANKDTWTGQISHYISTYHPGVDPNLAGNFANIAFHGISGAGPVPTKGGVSKELDGDMAAIKAGLSDNKALSKALVKLTMNTRNALIDGLSPGPGKQTGGNSLQTSSNAPTSTPNSSHAQPSPRRPGGTDPRPSPFGDQRESAPPSRFTSERFDPDKRGITDGKVISGRVTQIRFDVRHFETTPGNWVRELTVPIDLVSHSGSVSPEVRAQIAAEIQQSLDDNINNRHQLPGGDQLHVTVQVRTPPNGDRGASDWQSNNSKSVPVNVFDPGVDTALDARTNQLAFNAHDPAAIFTHEVMHFAGLGEGYVDKELLFGRQDQAGVMGPKARDGVAVLTDDNVSKLDEVSRQAGPIRDHPLVTGPATVSTTTAGHPTPSAEAAPHPQAQTLDPPSGPPPGFVGPFNQGSENPLQSPTNSPTPGTINGLPAPDVTPGAVVGKVQFAPAQDVQLSTHGMVAVVAGGADKVSNFHDAVVRSLPADAPKEHARITGDLDRFRQDNPLNDNLDTLAEVGGVHVHVLKTDGSWQSVGPVTGRPVHVVETEVNGKPSFLGTKQDVQIGLKDVVYPGSTTMSFNGGKHLVHRGEFEVETIAGKHYVRMYTAVANPAPAGSSHKDVHQDQDGKVTLSGGSGDTFWAGGGRPLRAVQWVAKYQGEWSHKPEMKPVLRSYLVPLENFNNLTRNMTLEGAPHSDGLSMNVDQNADTNQFGVRGVDLKALQDNALPGSLVTYAPGGSKGYGEQNLAGRQEDIADLYSRLGIDPGFSSTALGHRNDPWFDWVQQKDGSWKFGGFRNDPGALRKLAEDLTNQLHAWKNSDLGKSADRLPDAMIEPHTDSIPEPKGGGGGGRKGSAKPLTPKQREENLNVFINSFGPPAENLNHVTTVVSRDFVSAVNSEITTTPPPVDPKEFQKLTNEAVKFSFQSVKSTTENSLNKLHVPEPGAPPRVETVEHVVAVLKHQDFDSTVVDPIAGKIATSVSQHDAFQLLERTTPDTQTKPGLQGLHDALHERVHALVKQNFTELGGNGEFAKQLNAAKQGAGKKAGWFSGDRAEKFFDKVVKDLKTDPTLVGKLKSMDLKIDPKALNTVLEDQVLPEAASKNLDGVKKENLIGVSPDELRGKLGRVLPVLNNTLGTQLKGNRALGLIDKTYRDDLAAKVSAKTSQSGMDALGKANFTTVKADDVDHFMDKLPSFATQAQISAAIGTDARRAKVDFNTRGDQGEPFANNFGHWRDVQVTGYTRKHDHTVFTLHREVGSEVSATIDRELADPNDMSAKNILDKLVTGVDRDVSAAHDQLGRKFAEVVKVERQNTQYRANPAANPNTFGEHAQMVLNQFLKLTKNDVDATRFVSRDALAKAILFHDMEKVNSKNQFGDGQGRHDQEPEHRGAIDQMNRHEGIWNDKREFVIARAVVDSDPFGFYMRNMGLKADDVHAFIHDLAQKVKNADGSDPSPSDELKFFDEFHQYYQADFSSYTSDARFVNDNTDELERGKNALRGFDRGGVDDPLKLVDGGRRFAYDNESKAGKVSYEQKFRELRKVFEDAATAAHDQSSSQVNPLQAPANAPKSDSPPVVQEDKLAAVPSIPLTPPVDGPLTPAMTPATREPSAVEKMIPEYTKGNKALGAVVATQVKGAADVGRSIDSLLSNLKQGNSVGVDRIVSALNPAEFESFLGDGRSFGVRVGNTWFEASVKAELKLKDAGPDKVTTPASDTRVDVTVQTGASYAETHTGDTSHEVGLSGSGTLAVGPYVWAGGHVVLSAPSTDQTLSAGFTEQRAIRSGGNSKTADVDVAYTITVTSADGRGMTGSIVDGNVSLQISGDVSEMKPPKLPATLPTPDADWAEKVEFKVAEAVVIDDPKKLFDTVSRALHPSVTKIGAPGRTSLQEFLSPSGIRAHLGQLFNGGPALSADLVSPHGSYRSAVRMDVELKSAELVGVPGTGDLRVQETSTAGRGQSASTKAGFDANITLGYGAPGGYAGLSGAMARKTTETSQSGSTSTSRAGIQVKGEAGMYKVAMEVKVTTPGGEVITVPATSYIRMGLPEAKARGLAVPDGTADKFTDVGKRFEPPYLASEMAAGNIKVGEFAAAAKVQSQVEETLKNLTGFEKFLPKWTRSSPETARTAKNGSEFAEQLANLRKIAAVLSPTALKSKMDSLVGPGVSVQLKRTGLFTDTFLSVTVKAKTGEGTHLGQADGHSVRAASTVSPQLGSSTSTEKSWSAGAEGQLYLPVVTNVVRVTPSPGGSVGVTGTTTHKNAAGPTVTSSSTNAGSPDAQVFSHDVEFEVEITSYTRNRPWVKRLTPGSPFRITPTVSTIAKTGASGTGQIDLPKISGKVDLWVNDGSSLKTDPAAFAPQPVTSKDIAAGNVPTIKGLLGRKLPAAPKWLHVEAVANTEALRTAAIDQLTRAAGGDGVLGLPGSASRNRVDALFSPEVIKANLHKLVGQGVREGGLKYDRRLADRVGALGMSMSLSAPKLVTVAEAGGIENTLTGGSTASYDKSHQTSVDTSLYVNLPIRAAAHAKGQGGVRPSVKWRPWSKTSGASREISAQVDHNLSTPSTGRTVLVQFDADVRIVAETRLESLVNGSSMATGADVKMPGAVFVRVSETEARALGLLPPAPATTPVPGTMTPPAMLRPDEPSSLGLGVVEEAPNLTGLVHNASTELGKLGSRLLPQSVLNDSMNNLQRMLDLTSDDSVKALVDSALDGGVPLLVHDPGLLGKDTYQVTLHAKVTEVEFSDVVNDGISMDHTLTRSTAATESAGTGTSYGVGLRVHARGVINDPKVTGSAGGFFSTGVTKSHSDSSSKTSSETAEQTRLADGPAVRYKAKVQFELVVEKGGMTLPPITSVDGTMVVRTPADNEKIAVGGRQAPGSVHNPTDKLLTPAEGTAASLQAWQSEGRPLPSSASAEGLRGVGALRDAAVRALKAAGANEGIVGSGTGAKNTLWSSLNTDVVQANLPGMVDGSLDVPGLHEASVLVSQHAGLKVYARMANPKLAGLSDGIDLNRAESSGTSTSTDSKDTLIADTGVNLGTVALTDSHKNEPYLSGVEVRANTDTSRGSSAGTSGSHGNTLKAKGRSGLVGFDVEYRVVADLAGGKTAVVELTVPDSVRIRVSDADLETVLGNGPLPAALTTAQDEVKSTADTWRGAEEATDKAQRAADDLWLEQPVATQEHTQVTTGLDTSTKAMGVLDTRIQGVKQEFRQALASAKDVVRDTGVKLRTGSAQVADLQFRADQALTLAGAADPASADPASADHATVMQVLRQANTELENALGRQAALARERSDAQDRAARIDTVLDGSVAQRDQLRALPPATGHLGTLENTLADLEAQRQRLDAAQGTLRTAQDVAAAKIGDLADRRAAALTTLADARRDADAARQKWWDAKVDVDQRVADVNSGTRQQNRDNVFVQVDDNSDEEFDPSVYMTENAGNTANTVADAGVFHGTDWETGELYSFGQSDLVSRSLTDHEGNVIGVTFLPSDTADIEQRWASQDTGETGLLEKGVTNDVLGPRLDEMSRTRKAQFMGGRPFGQWSHNTQAPWAADKARGGTFFVMTHGSPTSVTVNLLGQGPAERTVRIDGGTLARIVTASEQFALAGAQDRPSATLIACWTGRLTEPGGLAHDFQQALANLGGPSTVHAPTKPAAFTGDNLETGKRPMMGQALGLRGGFTTVTDGGHWATFGDSAETGHVVDELVQAMSDGHRYAEPARPTGDDRIPLSDRGSTVELANSLADMLVTAVEGRESGGALPLTAVAPAVGVHERPDILWPAILTKLAGRDDIAPKVRWVVDREFDAHSGQWVPVDLPPAARALYTVIGKGDWADDQVRRPIRMNEPGSSGPARDSAVELAPDAMRVLFDDGGSVANEHDVGQFASWFAESVLEREQDGVSPPVVHFTGPRDLAEEARYHFGAEVEQRLDDLTVGHADQYDTASRLKVVESTDPTVTITSMLPGDPGPAASSNLSDSLDSLRSKDSFDPADWTEVDSADAGEQGYVVVPAKQTEQQARAQEFAEKLTSEGRLQVKYQDSFGILHRDGGSVEFKKFDGGTVRLDQKEWRAFVRNAVLVQVDTATVADRNGGELTGRIDGSPPMTMEFDKSGISFAHRSYNAPAPVSVSGVLQPNDHLTIENSLATLLAHARHDPEFLQEFLQERLTKNKRDFNDQLGWHNYGEIDNLHFRPDKAAQAGANRGLVDPSEVDKSITLRQFLDFVDNASEKLGLSQRLREQITGSIGTVRGRMAVDADKLYFSSAGNRDLAKFVVLVTKLTDSRAIPEALSGLADRPTRVPIVGSDVPTILAGTGDYTPALNSILDRHWPTVVHWITHPDAVSANPDSQPSPDQSANSAGPEAGPSGGTELLTINVGTDPELTHAKLKQIVTKLVPIAKHLTKWAPAAERGLANPRVMITSTARTVKDAQWGADMVAEHLTDRVGAKVVKQAPFQTRWVVDKAAPPGATVRITSGDASLPDRGRLPAVPTGDYGDLPANSRQLRNARDTLVAARTALVGARKALFLGPSGDLTALRKTHDTAWSAFRLADQKYSKAARAALGQAERDLSGARATVKDARNELRTASAVLPADSTRVDAARVAMAAAEAVQTKASRLLADVSPGVGHPVPTSILDDESWLNSEADTADWSNPRNPVSERDIREARLNAPYSVVSSEVTSVWRTPRAWDPRPRKLHKYGANFSYDLRRFTVGGVGVKDYTVRLYLDVPATVSAPREFRVRADAKIAVDRFYNPGYRLPSGDQLHVTLQFVSSAAEAHHSVKLDDSAGYARSNTGMWWIGAPEDTFAHEIGHLLGLNDEYADPKTAFTNLGRTLPEDAVRTRAHADRITRNDSRLHEDNALMTGRTDRATAKLKPRNIYQLEKHSQGLGTPFEPTAGLVLTAAREDESDTTVVEELVASLGRTDVPATPKPGEQISIADRAGTRWLTRDLAIKLAAAVKKPGAVPGGLRLTDVAAEVGRHERPEVIWSALVTWADRTIAGSINHVVDRKFDHQAGRWVPVELPAMARDLYTVTGKAEWVADEVLRPIRLLRPDEPGPWRVAGEAVPEVLTISPTGESIHNVSEVDILARWLAESAIERSSDRVPLPIARVAGQGALADATRTRLFEETSARLALLSPLGARIDARAMIHQSPSDAADVTVSVSLPDHLVTDFPWADYVAVARRVVPALENGEDLLRRAEDIVRPRHGLPTAGSAEFELQLKLTGDIRFAVALRLHEEGGDVEPEGSAQHLSEFLLAMFGKADLGTSTGLTHLAAGPEPSTSDLYSHDAGLEVQHHSMLDAEGRVVGVSFLTAANSVRNVGAWTAAPRNTDTYGFASGVAGQSGVRQALANRQYTREVAPWSADATTGGTFYVNAPGVPDSVEVVLRDGRTKMVDGGTLARIVARTDEFRSAGERSSVTLLVCSAGKFTEDGGVAVKFAEALREFGGPSRVHAPTTGMFMVTEGASGSAARNAVTYVEDGGYWNTVDDGASSDDEMTPPSTPVLGPRRAQPPDQSERPPAVPVEEQGDRQATSAEESEAERELANARAAVASARADVRAAQSEPAPGDARAQSARAALKAAEAVQTKASRALADVSRGARHPEPRSILDDESWRTSEAATAEWSEPLDPVREEDIRVARREAPASVVASETNDVLRHPVKEDFPAAQRVKHPEDDSKDSRYLGRLDGSFGYDLRRFTVNGVGVQDYTVRLYLDTRPNPDALVTASAVSGQQIADLRVRAKLGVDQFFNPGYRLPSGDQLHVTVQFVGSAAEAHHSILVDGSAGVRRSDQGMWWIGAQEVTLAHEVGHLLGLDDEYADVASALAQGGKARTAKATRTQAHAERIARGGSRVHSDDGLMTAGYKQKGAALKPRNLYVLEKRAQGLGTLPEPMSTNFRFAEAEPAQVSDEFLGTGDVPAAGNALGLDVPLDDLALDDLGDDLGMDLLDFGQGWDSSGDPAQQHQPADENGELEVITLRAPARPEPDVASVDPAAVAEIFEEYRTRPAAIEVLTSEITRALATNGASLDGYRQALTALDLYGVVGTFLSKDVDPRLSAGALFDVLDRAATDTANSIEYAGKIADKMDELEAQGLIDTIFHGPGEFADRRRVLSGHLDGRQRQDTVDSPRLRSSEADRAQFRSGYSDYGRGADLVRRAVEEDLIQGPVSAEEDLVSVAASARPEFLGPINAALRSGDEAAVGQYEPLIRLITSGMNRLPVYQGGITRTIDLPDTAAAQVAAARYEPGTVVQEQEFTSASIAHNQPGQIRFLINSGSGREVWRVSGTGAGEVAFPPGTRFKVVFREAQGDRWLIGLDEQVTEPPGKAEVVAGNGPRPVGNPLVWLSAKAMALLDKAGLAGSLAGDVFAEAIRGIAQGWDGDEIGRNGTFEQRAEVTMAVLRVFRRRRLTVVNLGWLARWRVAAAVRGYVAMEKEAMAELDAEIAELDEMGKAEGVIKSDG